MTSPTDRQRQVLALIQSSDTRPSYSAIAQALGIHSKSTAWKHVHALIRKGKLPGTVKRRPRVLPAGWF